MSRRKDRDRFIEMKRLNPDYQGFRGFGQGPASDSTPLESVTCSVCGRRRNVPANTIPEQRDSYVCLSCLEETEEQDQESEQQEAHG